MHLPLTSCAPVYLLQYTEINVGVQPYVLPEVDHVSKTPV
jgi:hypothetical protein